MPHSHLGPTALDVALACIGDDAACTLTAAALDVLARCTEHEKARCSLAPPAIPPPPPPSCTQMRAVGRSPPPARPLRRPWPRIEAL
jgi:hypothetical protein